jgi:photosystem II stability/assembly factor-like uncharacterized protein
MWYAATNEGLYISEDQGKKWYGQPVMGQQDLVTVQRIDGNTLAVASATRAFVSHDGGKNWAALALPSYVTVVYGLAAAPDGTLWLSTREGALSSRDQGNSWEHRLGGLPAREVLSVHYDAGSQRLLATGLHTRTVFQSKDDGRSWQPLPTSLVSIRAATIFQGRILAATSHNGLLLEEPEQKASAVEHRRQISADAASSKQ